MARFCFLHVGPDVTAPSLLAQSLRRHHPDAEIIQCSDKDSPAATDTSSVHRFDGDVKKMMTFRLHCFGEVGLPEPTWFFDTDMLCIAPLDAQKALGDADVAVCERQFRLHGIFNHAYAGLDFSEYRGMTFRMVYPYHACATLVRHPKFWSDCLQLLLTRPEKFHLWYGDQEALREMMKGNTYRSARLPESIYACLPEYEQPGAAMLHYKGETRKPHMLTRAAAIKAKG